MEKMFKIFFIILILLSLILGIGLLLIQIWSYEVAFVQIILENR